MTVESAEFADVYKKNFGRVYQYFRSRGLEVNESEELTQDTFLCALEKWSQLKYRGKFPFWIKSIARNILSNYLRNNRTLKRKVEKTSFEEEGFQPQKISNIDDLLFIKNIVSSLRKMPMEVEKIVVLKAAYGYSFKEISDIIGKNQNTVASIYRRAIIKLSKELHSVPIKKSNNGLLQNSKKIVR